MIDKINLKKEREINYYSDKVLSFLKDYSNEEPCNLDIKLFNVNGLNFNNRDKKIIFNRLLTDGHIAQMSGDKQSDYDKTYITMKGLLFCIDGGYKRMRCNRILNKTSSIAKSIFIFTASVVGIVYTFLQIMNYYHLISCCCCCHS